MDDLGFSVPHGRDYGSTVESLGAKLDHVDGASMIKPFLPLLLAATLFAQQSPLQKSTTPAEQDPTLKDTQQWMQDTSSMESNIAADIVVSDGGDSGQLLALPEDSWNAAWYSDDGINANDGHVHEWTMEKDVYDVTFKTCSMTIYPRHLKSETIRATAHDAFLALTKSKWTTVKDAPETLELENYDPDSVNVRERVSKDMPMLVYKTVPTTDGGVYAYHGVDPLNRRVPAMKYWGDSSGGIGLNFPDGHWSGLISSFEFPYAVRFAKALRHTIVLCGGKAPLF